MAKRRLEAAVPAGACAERKREILNEIQIILKEEEVECRKLLDEQLASFSLRAKSLSRVAAIQLDPHLNRDHMPDLMQTLLTIGPRIQIRGESLRGSESKPRRCSSMEHDAADECERLAAFQP